MRRLFAVVSRCGRDSRTGAALSPRDDRVDCYRRTAPVDAAHRCLHRLIASGTVKGRPREHLRRRGMAWSDKGQLDRAIADFDQALTLVPTSAAIHVERGFAVLTKGDNEAALADFDAAIRSIQPRAAYLGHGTAQTNLRRYDLADHGFRRGDPARSAIGRRLQQPRLRLSAQPASRTAPSPTDKAIALDPRDPSALSNRGLAYQVQGRPRPRRCGLSTKRSALDPKSVELVHQPRRILARQGRFRPRAGRLRNRHQARPELAQFLSARLHLAGAGEPRSRARRARQCDPARCAIYRRLCPSRPRLRGEGRPRACRAPTMPPRSSCRRNTSSARARRRWRARGSRCCRTADATPAPAPASPPAALRRIALVIGNGRYANVTALPNPPNDARAVASTLARRRLRRDGRHRPRPRRHEAHGRRNFLRSAAGAQVALLVLRRPRHADRRPQLSRAGRRQARQRRRACRQHDRCRHHPRRPRRPGRAPTSSSSMPAATIRWRSRLRRRPARSRSVNVAAGLAAPRGLGAGATRGAGTLIAFATAPGQVALDGSGANSPFSAALVRHVAHARARSAADAHPRARRGVAATPTGRCRGRTPRCSARCFSPARSSRLPQIGPMPLWSSPRRKRETGHEIRRVRPYGRYGMPLAQLYADRLQLAEAYDRAGIHAYHLAEHHATPLGCASSPGCSWRRWRSVPTSCASARWSICCRSTIRCG